MKKPLLTAREYELLTEFSAQINTNLLPKPVDFGNLQVQESNEEPELLPRTTGLTAQLVKKEQLNKDASRPIYYYEFETRGEELFDYEPGDSIGFYPELPGEEVEWLAERLGFDLNQVVKISGWSAGAVADGYPLFPASPSRIRDILCRLDVKSFPKKAVLRTLAEYCQDETESQILLFLSSRTGSDAYNRLRTEMLSIRLLLAALDSLKLPLEALISLAGPLQARYYSCCRKQQGKSFQIVFNVSGVCSTWLESLSVTDNNPPYLPIHKRSINHFRLPEVIEPSRPIIMIAAGTGVAPFIGFLEVLNCQKETSFNWLIFGFRNLEDDFIFETELNDQISSKTLSKLSLAVSRDQNQPKLYVQDLILQQEKQLFTQLLLERDALIYICGDQLTMIKGVNEAIVQIIRENDPNLTQKEAENVLMTWTREKKVNRDIWV